MELKINPEFQALIPPLSAEELDSLTESLAIEGCREPILLWNGYIVDGHNRYKICKEYDIKFKTSDVKDLPTELDVKQWMINNQFARRNLSTEARLALAYKLKEIETEKAKARKATTQFKENTDSPLIGSPQNESDEIADKGKTLEIIAKKAGVSKTTAEQYDATAKNEKI